MSERIWSALEEELAELSQLLEEGGRLYTKLDQSACTFYVADATYPYWATGLLGYAVSPRYSSVAMGRLVLISVRMLDRLYRELAKYGTGGKSIARIIRKRRLLISFYEVKWNDEFGERRSEKVRNLDEAIIKAVGKYGYLDARRALADLAFGVRKPELSFVAVSPGFSLSEADVEVFANLFIIPLTEMLLFLYVYPEDRLFVAWMKEMLPNKFEVKLTGLAVVEDASEACPAALEHLSKACWETVTPPRAPRYHFTFNNIHDLEAMLSTSTITEHQFKVAAEIKAHLEVAAEQAKEHSNPTLWLARSIKALRDLLPIKSS